MINDSDIRQRLNLLRDSRSFVLHELGEAGEAAVLSPTVVPRDSGVYWVGGMTVLQSGSTIESVFRADTDSGGSLVSIYWWIKGEWYAHDDEESLSVLKLSREQVFPFDWQFAVPLEHDSFHSR